MKALPADRIFEIFKAVPGLEDEVRQDATVQYQMESPDFHAEITQNNELRSFVTKDLQNKGYLDEQDIAEIDTVAKNKRVAEVTEPAAPEGDGFSTPQRPLTMPPAASGHEGVAAESKQTGTSGAKGAPGEVTSRKQKTPYRTNIPALRELYTQYGNLDSKLERFGKDFFRNAKIDSTTTDLSANTDYVLGSGDELRIDVCCALSRHFTSIIDREGRLSLPQAGSIPVAGRTLAEAQKAIESAFADQFKGVNVYVALGRIRTIRIFVVGDVIRPGAYDISALSTPLNALLEAGGPSDSGSMRVVHQMRHGREVGQIDLYDLLLHGSSRTQERLESGDTLLIPPIGPEVTVVGMVRRPAIYELHGATSLGDILEMAGGITSTASVSHIRIDRVVPHAGSTMEEVSVSDTSAANLRRQLATHPLQDGDRVTISPVVAYNAGAVYLDGHVAIPGKYPYHVGMTVKDLVPSFQDLLPEASNQAQLIRLQPPDYHPVAILIDLAGMITGKMAPMVLQPLDTLRVRGRYELDPVTVSIYGEVPSPGKYPLADRMTAGDLVRIAGGVLQSASIEEADLVTYSLDNDHKVVTDTRLIPMREILAGKPDTDIVLHPNDVLTIRKIAGWTDIGAAIKVIGQVRFAATYAIQRHEKLSSVLKRAGGFTDQAFPDGAILNRVQVKELAEQRKATMIEQIRNESASLRAGPKSASTDTSALTAAYIQQQQQILDQLSKQPTSGRLVIHIGPDISKWEGTAADIEVQNGDELLVPKVPNFVSVAGQVYYPAAFTFLPGKKVKWYVNQSGGATKLANTKDMIIVRADGSVLSARQNGGWFHSDFMETRLHPGETVVVPSRILGGSLAWKNLLDAAQFASAIAIAARLATGL